MNTDQAREYFKPLTYDDLTEKNFNKLVAILTEVLGKWNRQVLEDREEHGHDNRYYMEIHPHKRFGRYPGTRFIDKKDKEAFIMVKCDNYSVRTGISFNKDGFIGFAGWADSDNVKPFIQAFREWVDIIKRDKLPGLWTSEQEEFLTHLKNEQPLMGLNIMTCSGLTKEQRDSFFNSYFVTEFPENPVTGALICMDGKEYVYSGTDWCRLGVK